MKIEKSNKNNRKSMGKSKPEVIFPVPSTQAEMPEGYINFIKKIKETISQQRIKTVISANNSMILLYWEIGNSILERQKNEGWGAKVIDRMSYDLRNEFPDMKGFSPRNLKYIRLFAEEWPDMELVQRTVALIPWRSNITLLDKLKDPKLRLWYAQKTLERGFGKDMLVFQIETLLHLREGSAINNFKAALPPADSDESISSDKVIWEFIKFRW
jgi:predicted nuclease of restriction endonuclease-like (RecB) superfamily